MVEINKIATGYHNRACNKIHKFLGSHFTVNIYVAFASDHP